MYVIGGILSYGICMGFWYQWYEERGLTVDSPIVIITWDVWLYTIGPIGLITALANYYTDDYPRKYLFKWSFKGLNEKK